MAECTGAITGRVNSAQTVNVQKSKVIKRVWLLEFLITGYRESNPYDLPMPICHGHPTLRKK